MHDAHGGAERQGGLARAAHGLQRVGGGVVHVHRVPRRPALPPRPARHVDPPAQGGDGERARDRLREPATRLPGSGLFHMLAE